MKKTLIFSIIISFATCLHAQGVVNKVEAPEVRETITKLLAEVDSVKTNPIALNGSIRKLGTQLQNNRNMKVYMSSTTTANVAEKLIQVFDSIDDQGTNAANKLRIIEVIGFSDNSLAARKFIMGIVDNGTNKHREMALWSLSPKGVHGDDVYQKIKDNVKKGAIREEDSFLPLQRADKAKALPEMRKFLSSTKDLKHFIKVGMLLCDYQDPALIDVLVERQGDFKVAVPVSATAAIDHMEPAEAINSNMLKKYIDVNEGKKVAQALEILNKKGTAGDKDLPLFEKKLNSASLETREAIVGFLKSQVGGGNISAERLSPILDKAFVKENNESVKTQIKGLIDSVKQKKANGVK